MRLASIKRLAVSPPEFPLEAGCDREDKFFCQETYRDWIEQEEILLKNKPDWQVGLNLADCKLEVLEPTSFDNCVSLAACRPTDIHRREFGGRVRASSDLVLTTCDLPST